MISITLALGEASPNDVVTVRTRKVVHGDDHHWKFAVWYPSLDLVASLWDVNISSVRFPRGDAHRVTEIKGHPVSLYPLLICTLV